MAGWSGAILNFADTCSGIGVTRAIGTRGGWPVTRRKRATFWISPEATDAGLSAELRRHGLSLRLVVAEIASVIGSF